jgi:hypothetical protein
MSEQTVETTVVETSARVPLWKNKKVVITAVAVTTVAVVLAALKFNSNETEETDTELAPAETTSSKK